MYVTQIAAIVAIIIAKNFINGSSFFIFCSFISKLFCVSLEAYASFHRCPQLAYATLVLEACDIAPKFS